MADTVDELKKQVRNLDKLVHSSQNELGAVLPLTAITAWELLFDRLGVPYGVKTQEGAILIVNGAGGVESILTQLARRLTGLTVITTAPGPTRSPGRRKWVLIKSSIATVRSTRH